MKKKQFGDYYNLYIRDNELSPHTPEQRREKILMALGHYCDDLNARITKLEELNKKT